MARRPLTADERTFLADPPPRALARIATVDDEGMPHVVPGGWSHDDADDELVLGGRDVPRTRRARHVERAGVAAVVIDGLADGPGWRPWGLAIRGPARLDTDAGAIRVRIEDVASWGLHHVLGRRG